jgi:ADP-ribose pyrophosphatase YjhB (NUDIX family)
MGARRVSDGRQARYSRAMVWRRRLWPLVKPVIRANFRLRRGVTLGVRGVVTDDEGRVLLVEHTYLHGWHLPGGGVDSGECAEDALARELQEEGGVRLTGPARLVSLTTGEEFRGDHVALFRAGDWEPCAAAEQGEILRIGWFAPDALPPDTTARTRVRIEAALGIGAGLAGDA